MNTKRIPCGSSLVLMVGPSGAGKSTFCERFNGPNTVVLSADELREEFTGDFRRQDKNDLVFEEFFRRIDQHIRAGNRVVADATHLKFKERQETAQIGVRNSVPVTYVVVNRDLESKIATGGWRNDVRVGNKTLVEKHDEMFKSQEHNIVQGDGLADLVVDTRKDEFEIVDLLPRHPKTALMELRARGYDKVRVVGDVHGNLDGLNEATKTDKDTFLLFLGDIMDYGRDSLKTVEIVDDLVRSGKAACLRGNHERKIFNYVVQERGDGFRGTLTHGNDVTVDALKELTPAKRNRWEAKLMNLVNSSPDWMQIANWMFVHGAALPEMFDNQLFRANRSSKVESHALFGETDGTLTEDGFPNRTYNWVREVPANHNVVVGHDIRSTDRPFVVENLNQSQVVFLDTGSSKTKDQVEGKLSWLDLKLHPDRIEQLEFGQEFT